jgi:hypothetical protein
VRLVAASVGGDVEALAHAAACATCRGVMRDELALHDLARELAETDTRAGLALSRARKDELAAELLARADRIEVLPAVEPPSRLRRAGMVVSIAAAAVAVAAGVMVVVRPAPPKAATVVATAGDEVVQEGPAIAGQGGNAAAGAGAGSGSVSGSGSDSDSVSVSDSGSGSDSDPVSVAVSGSGSGSASGGADASASAGAKRPRATVTANDFARFDRKTVNGIDRIALRDGTLSIEGIAGGLPVLVVADNVKIRAGHAKLQARADRGVVLQVQVFSGSVEILGAERTEILREGETWTWDDTAVATARTSAFRRGWDALRAGEFERAAIELEAAAGDAGLGEDASYWAAIAWGRAGQAAKARAGLERFLERYPRATRAGEAHLALARLLDDPDAARAHREAAARDPDPRVRAAAEAALASP